MTAPLDELTKEQLLEKLVALDDEASRAEFLSNHPRLLQAEIVTELTEQVREQVRVDVQRALRMADTVLSIANQLGDKQGLALAKRYAKAKCPLCERRIRYGGGSARTGSRAIRRRRRQQ